MYRIKIDYTTGDSFSSERRTRCLDGTWTNLEVLAENLRRIKEHYQWYVNKKNTYSYRPIKEVDPPVYAGEEYPESSIKFLLDDKTEYLLSTFWTGYFEQLHGASIEIHMGFEID